MRGQLVHPSVHTEPYLVLKGPLKGHPQRDSGPSGPCPTAHLSRRCTHPEPQASCHHPDCSLSPTPPGPQHPPLRVAHTRPPSSFPDLLLPPPQVHFWHGSRRGLSRTLPRLLTLLALPSTASASGPDPTGVLAFSGTPTHSHLRPSCPYHGASPRGHRRSPCSPTSAHRTSPGLASAVFHSWR